MDWEIIRNWAPIGISALAALASIITLGILVRDVITRRRPNLIVEFLPLEPRSGHNQDGGGVRMVLKNYGPGHAYNVSVSLTSVGPAKDNGLHPAFRLFDMGWGDRELKTFIAGREYAREWRENHKQNWYPHSEMYEHKARITVWYTRTLTSWWYKKSKWTYDIDDFCPGDPLWYSLTP